MRQMHTICRMLLTAAVVVVTVAAAAASTSNKWRIEVNHDAGSTGEIVFKPL